MIFETSGTSEELSLELPALDADPTEDRKTLPIGIVPSSTSAVFKMGAYTSLTSPLSMRIYGWCATSR
jgi:hypothetical protein